MRPDDTNSSGECDVAIAGLQIWVHGREFEDSTDYWDGNWLRVTVRCEYSGACVRVDGPIVHLGELHRFLAGVETLYATLDGGAKLDCIEKNLKVELVADKRGHIHVTIDVTPDHLQQSHRFLDELDQTYLPGLMAACRATLAKYPLRGHAG